MDSNKIDGNISIKLKRFNQVPHLLYRPPALCAHFENCNLFHIILYVPAAASCYTHRMPQEWNLSMYMRQSAECSILIFIRQCYSIFKTTAKKNDKDVIKIDRLGLINCKRSEAWCAHRNIIVQCSDRVYITKLIKYTHTPSIPASQPIGNEW